MNITKPTKALFLDRDGVINIDHGYVHKIEDFEFKEGIFEICSFFQVKNFLLIIITNQSGIGRGYYTKNDFHKLSNWMIEQFKEKKISITDIFFSPALPTDNSFDRKPNPGMLLKAQEKYNISFSESWLIGDKKSDIQAGQNAKVKNLIFLNNSKELNNNRGEGYYVVDNLKHILNIAKKELS